MNVAPADDADTPRQKHIRMAVRSTSFLNSEGATHSAGLVIDWIRVSRHVRRVKETEECVADCARLLARKGSTSRAEMLDNLDVVAREVLRVSRVRLDCVCMLLWQAFFQTLREMNYSVYLYADASP